MPVLAKGKTRTGRLLTYVRDDRPFAEGGRRAAALYALIATAKLNDIDPQAWLADMFARLPDLPPSASTNTCRGTGRLRSVRAQVA